MDLRNIYVDVKERANAGEVNSMLEFLEKTPLSVFPEGSKLIIKIFT